MEKPAKVEHLAMYQLLDRDWKNLEVLKKLLWVAYLEGKGDGYSECSEIISHKEKQ